MVMIDEAESWPLVEATANRLSMLLEQHPRFVTCVLRAPDSSQKDNCALYAKFPTPCPLLT